MSDCNAKMHLVQFWLGRRPGHYWGNLQRSPDPLAGCKGAYFYNGWGVKNWGMGE